MNFVMKLDVSREMYGIGSSYVIKFEIGSDDNYVIDTGC